MVFRERVLHAGQILLYSLSIQTIPMKKLFISTCLTLFVMTGVLAQGTQLLRQPTVSESNIVFVYANDLWIVSKDGGDARRLTSSEGQESFPHFSPDGKLI